MKEDERVKGQVAAADAFRDWALCATLEVIGMTVIWPGACAFFSCHMVLAHGFGVPARYPPFITLGALMTNILNKLLRLFHLFTLYNHTEVFIILMSIIVRGLTD